MFVGGLRSSRFRRIAVAGRPRSRVPGIAFLLGAFLVPLSTSPAPAAPAAPSLGRILDAHGAPALTHGFRGALDPAGFRMSLAPDGSPRFLPEASVPADRNWDDRFPFPGAGGLVKAVAVLGSDLYVAGDFLQVGGVDVRHIARWNGRAWDDVGGGLSARSSTSGTVNSLAVQGDSLIAGGFFTHAGDTTAAPNLARWNGSDWAPVGGGVGDEVDVVCAHGGRLYVGGRFLSAGSTYAQRIAMWDGSAWTAFGDGLGDNLNPSTVRAIAVSGDTVYAGGDFLALADTTAGSIARWDGSAWDDLQGGVDGVVYALALFQGRLYVGGDFNRVAGEPGLALAAWDGSSWSGPGGGADGPVWSLLAAGGRLYVGGAFSHVGTEALNRIAAWDGAGWSGLGVGTDAVVRALAADDGGDLYAGGDFISADNVLARRVAIYRDGGWNALGEGLEATVRAVAPGPGGLYVGGDFSSAGGELVNHITRWTGAGWDTLASGLDGPVYAIAAYGNQLVVGGSFTGAGGVPAANVALWDGGEWHAMGAGFNGICRSLAVTDDGELYAGGSFTSSGGVPLGRLGHWNPVTRIWEQVGGGFSNPYSVEAMAADGPSLVVGGIFNGVGGVTASNIARWNGTAWEALGPGVNGEVYSVAVAGGRIYAAGDFYFAGDTQANGVAYWDGAAWNTGFAAGLDTRTILSVAATGDSLYIGGSFTVVGDTAASGVALWTGTGWEPLGSGVNGPVSVMTLENGHLDVGGGFTRAGAFPSYHFGRWEVGGMVPVTLLSFTAGRSGSGIVLRWSADGASVDHAGFDVYREDPDGRRIRLNLGVLTSGPGYAFTDTDPPGGAARYWLAELSRSGGVTWYGPASVEPAPVPRPRLRLAQNRPNPVAGTTRIAFATAEAGRVRLRVYDLAGRAVRTLVDEGLDAGDHEAAWDGNDAAGRRVGPGVYFYLIETPSGKLARKLVVLR